MINPKTKVRTVASNRGRITPHIKYSLEAKAGKEPRKRHNQRARTEINPAESVLRPGCFCGALGSISGMADFGWFSDIAQESFPGGGGKKVGGR